MLSGFIQLPVIIALYQISGQSLGPDFLADLYSFVQSPPNLNHSFLGLINLGQSSILIVGLAALIQYFQGRLSLLKRPGPSQNLTPAEKISRQMVVVAPVLTFIVFFNLPAAVTLYWLTTSLFSVFQQIVINRRLANGKLGIIHKENG